MAARIGRCSCPGFTLTDVSDQFQAQLLAGQARFLDPLHTTFTLMLQSSQGSVQQAPSASLWFDSPPARQPAVASVRCQTNQAAVDMMEAEPDCVKCRCECQLSGSLDAPGTLDGPLKRGGESSAALPTGALSAPSASWQSALNAVVPCCVVLR